MDISEAKKADNLGKLWAQAYAHAWYAISDELVQLKETHHAFPLPDIETAAASIADHIVDIHKSDPSIIDNALDTRG